MDDYKFEWDENKNLLNIKNHKITFEEASTVFKDDLAVMESDPGHSDCEERFHIIGYSQKDRMLLVCFCVREGDTIRIISARKAERKYRQLYEEINNL